MQRRTFLVGVGGSSLGASALIGSGAFSRIESQRRVKIEVAEDPDAYLGLDGCPDSDNSSYTEIDDSGHLAVEMSPKNENADNDLGSGINSDSFTWFDNVFQICNQGKDTVCVWITAEVAENLELDEEYEDEDIVDFYLGDDRDRSLLGEENAIELEVGECICVGIATVTKGLEEGDQLIDGDEIVIHADTDAECGIPDNDIETGNGRAGISFVAFCVPDDETITEGDIDPITVTKVNQSGDPIEIEFESDVEVQTVVLKAGNEFFNVDVNDDEGTAEVGERGTGIRPETGQQPGQSASRPCDIEGEDKCGVKFDWRPATFEFVFDGTTC